MAVEVKIPIMYRKFAGGKKFLEASPGKIKDILEEIMTEYPGLNEKFLDKEGGFKSNLNIFLNNKPVIIPGGLNTPAKNNDKLIILLAISGG